MDGLKISGENFYLVLDHEWSIIFLLVLICNECFCDSRFHVDKLSSAHVYLRMPKVFWEMKRILAYRCICDISVLTTVNWLKGVPIEDLPKEVLIDCAQLVKNNSIQGTASINFKTCLLTVFWRCDLNCGFLQDVKWTILMLSTHHGGIWKKPQTWMSVR